MSSLRYEIGQTFLEVVEQVAVAQSAVALFNPRLPVDVKGRGDRILFVIDRGDRLIEKAGQRIEKRVARIVVGALVLTVDTGPLEADTLHFAARTAIKWLRMNVDGENKPLLVSEVEVEPELKENVTEGSLLLSAYEIQYFQPYPEPPRA